ncbi:MAG: hypothetical protein E7173_00045 [Firmicutes bacterium]|nr:hypothetical protein [Bacillota bacterium]
MRKKDIFVGNINMCVKRSTTTSVEIGGVSFGHTITESELYKENAILIRLGKNVYADLENIDSHLHYVYLKAHHTDGILQRENVVLTTVPVDCGSLFVDCNTLTPYESLNCEKEIVSVKKLKMEVGTQKN